MNYMSFFFLMKNTDYLYLIFKVNVQNKGISKLGFSKWCEFTKKSMKLINFLLINPNMTYLRTLNYC